MARGEKAFRGVSQATTGLIDVYLLWTRRRPALGTAKLELSGVYLGYDCRSCLQPQQMQMTAKIHLVRMRITMASGATTDFGQRLPRLYA